MTSFTRFRKIHNKVGQEIPEVAEQSVVEEVFQEQPSVEVTAVIEEVVTETSTETLSSKAMFGFQKQTLSIKEHAEKIKGMTKLELDQYAEQYDIYLDRRQTKPNMINEFINKLKEKN